MDALESAQKSAWRASQVLVERAGRVIDEAGRMWRANKPTTPLAWTTFVGLALIALAAASSALVALSGTLLALCWAGVAAYTFLVSLATLGAFFVGGATLLFSGTCATCGCALLIASGYAYVAVCLYKYAKSSAASWATAPSTATGVATPRRVSPPPPAVSSAPAAKPAPQAQSAAAHSGTPTTPQLAAPAAGRRAAGADDNAASPDVAAQVASTGEEATTAAAVSATPAPQQRTAPPAPKPATPEHLRKGTDQRGGVKGKSAAKQQHQQQLSAAGAGSGLAASAVARELITAP
ncbi:hypothetical protein Rsub_07955 [Raphidocelis subcapitata]|uniref:Uncharacterized protein n=1 Tax=Raphidocelis subcapitata TaxID=307507 RepID=A0A2V0PBH9_9CHLO|nr:hypothetical protein Rsub_07955 [Raphidocelis subcapitata]|eukprot:GBF95240.1 hypothetical protein Rsub_07955 [Raphidocelis subcapitata]